MMTSSRLTRTFFAGACSLALIAGCERGPGESAGPNPGAELEARAASSSAGADDAALSANEQFDALIASFTADILKANPTLASSTGISEEELGFTYKDRFGTPGIEGYEEDQAFNDRARAAFGALDVGALSANRQEYLAILRAGMDAEDQLRSIGEEQGYYFAGGFRSPYIVTQIGGVHVNLPQFMTGTHALNTERDAEAYVARLELFYEQFQGAVELYEANAKAGALPPDYAVSGAIANAARFIAGPADENPLYRHLANRLQTLEVSDPDALLASALSAVESSVYPAYEALLSALRKYKDDATHDAGIWDIPRGDELYNLYIQLNGENRLDGAEIHALGLREVDRIQGEMEALFAEIGMTEGSIGERLTALTADPDQLFANTAEGKEELLNYVRKLVSDAEQVMEYYFLETPSSALEVLPVPAYAEQGAPAGYYNGPSEDGSRPGRYYINLRDTAAQPRFSLPTLTYHEAVPGHHFQIGLNADSKDVPLLVRFQASSTGYAEGWALYSEKMMAEVGTYEGEPEGNIGRLRDELFRAVRLVVDSGIHAKRWSREEAIDYMAANTGMEPTNVATEIERYSVWPGQALAYKTGMLMIEDLRARAEEALGEDFDLKVFHYEVLRGGGAPLAVLEERIDRWIAAGGPAPDLG